jgi:alpha-tubulin suppressor-like RCC1 family protein
MNRRAGIASLSFAVAAVVSCKAPPAKPPPPVRPLHVLVELALGSEHACARTETGRVFCWGANGHGQVGNAFTAKQPTPTIVDGLEDAVSITAGARHSCAIVKGGSIVCWGSNQHGQIGDGTGENRSNPTKVLDSGPFVQVAAGGDQTCARKKDGAVLCWGEAQPGASQKAPNPIIGVPPAEEIAVGLAHACARAVDGTVRCWGENYKRQLGHSKKAEEKGVASPIPDLVAGQLSLGREHSCARVSSGEVYCWGGGLNCVPGDAAQGRIIAVKPAKVTGMDNVLQVAAGGEVACALFASGQVGCTKLTDKDKSCATAPVAPAAIYGVRVLAVGGAFACAVLKGGLEAFCWGAGQSGQLGDGKMEDHLEPEPIKQPMQ